MRIATKLIKCADAVRVHIHEPATVTLTFAQRRRGRQRVHLDNEEGEIGISIDRGLPLSDGDVLVADDGSHVMVKAALEDVARVTATSSKQFARAAYHLGNRHVPLEVAENHLQFEYDTVLVDMLKQLGGVIVERSHAIFAPEVGAYGGGHRHGHDESFEEDYALAQAAYRAHDAADHDPSAVDHGHSHQHDDPHGTAGHSGHDHQHGTVGHSGHDHQHGTVGHSGHEHPHEPRRRNPGSCERDDKP